MSTRYYTQQEQQMLHKCSPHFLTRPLYEQGPMYIFGEHGAMTQLAHDCMRNEAKRQKRRGHKR